MLIQQYSAAAESWQAERNGWERSAEALMAQKAAASAVTKEDVSIILRTYIPNISICMFISTIYLTFLRQVVERMIIRHEDESKRWAHKVSVIAAGVLSYTSHH